MKERLQKVMAHAGVASRRAAETLIAKGRVRVNGTLVTSMGYKVDPAKDIIEVNGKPLKPLEKLRYVLYYKPLGVISSVYDPKGRPTVVDKVASAERLYPVGRLDINSSGLILLTNDGDLTYKLTHPKHEFPKTYVAEIQGHIKKEELYLLQRGIVLEDGVTAPAKAKLLLRQQGVSRVQITIHEGRNRQVRRMFDKLGYSVLRLCRTKIGFLDLGDLKPGQWRYLTQDEICRLKV